MEIERKFTINTLPDLTKYEVKEIVQGYLCTDPVVRVRKDGDRYYMTYKGKGFLAREEHNLPLTKDGYEHMITKSDGIIIKKKRYLIPYLSHTIELDIFEDELAPLIIAEVEFDTLEEANAFVKPDWFEDDVTEDPSYANANLSKRK